MSTAERSGFQHGTSEKPAGLEIPQCFLSSSPENRISPQTSPIPSALINGPLSKVAHPALIEMFSVLLFCSALNVHSPFLFPDFHPAVPSFQPDAQEQGTAPVWGGRQTDPQPTESRCLRGDVFYTSTHAHTHWVKYLVVSAGNLIPQPKINSCSNPVSFSWVPKRMYDPIPLFFIHGLGMVTLWSFKTSGEKTKKEHSNTLQATNKKFFQYQILL